MKEKVYVDRLFRDYEDTQRLRDFKEEITVNLQERVKEFMGKGVAADEAFEKATAELGDITSIADIAAKQKRSETIGQMYMKAKVVPSKRTAIGLTVATGILLLAMGLALLTYFGTSKESSPYYFSVVLLSCACGLYTYFGLTQETTAHFAMKKGRAFAYSIVCLVGVLGAGLAVTSFVYSGWAMSAALGMKMVLILPAICGLIFLLATETKRYKPWLEAMVDREMESSVKYSHADMVDPIKAARFGIMSGALWLFAIALFITLGVFAGWHVSWLPILFALPLQVLMTISIFKQDR